MHYCRGVKSCEVHIYLFFLSLADTPMQSVRVSDCGLQCLEAEAYDVTEVTTHKNTK